MRAVTIQRFANGKIVEEREGKNVFDLLRQLGMIKAPWKSEE